MDKTRKAAALAVIRLHKGGWANLTAKTVLAGSGLDGREKAFAAAVFYGTAERLATLDCLLAPYLKKPVAKLDTEVRAVLETGLYQMLYMNVPPRAAVDEAVKLTRSFGKASAAGLVNAVLRRAQAARLEDIHFGSELERVCVTWSVGAAVAKAVMEALPDEYDDFFAASFAQPELCLRVNTLRTSSTELVDKFGEMGISTQPGSLANCLYAKLPGGVAEEPLFAKGLYHVQGEASQFAAACVGAKPGERVLDLCAAPGGKSATLAQEMGGGEGLTACDIRENRLPLISETMTRLGIEGAKVLLNDAAVYREELAGQDRVLCDVPCSGLGVLAAKPDLRYTDGGHFAALPALHMTVLSVAARYVKRGGHA